MEGFDLIVLGAGPGGYTAALEAAGVGKSVLLVEAAQVGGVCLNRGCIPTKALLRAARLYREAGEGAAFGLAIAPPTYDMGGILAYAHGVQDGLRSGIASLLQKGKVTTITGTGRVVAPHQVEVAGQVYEGANILLAVGTSPARPPIPGLDLPGVVTSDDMLTGDGVDCASLLIIGGGVVGVEFAQIYADLGVRVTLVEALPRLLANLDRELGQSIAMNLKKRDVAVFTGAAVEQIVQEGDLLACTFADKKGAQTVQAQRVLVCTGRRPNTAGLLAPAVEEALGLERGYVPADEAGRTRLDGLWAVGDIVLGGIQLAHVAEAQARNAVAAMFGESLPKDLSCIPACVFTQPEIATVGLTQEGAKGAGIPAAAHKRLTSSNGKALIEGGDRGFVKLVVHQETGALLGAQLLAPHASELVGGLAAAIRKGMTLAELDATVFPHPTVSETIVH